jgi:hypothetical protein
LWSGSCQGEATERSAEEIAWAGAAGVFGDVRGAETRCMRIRGLLLESSLPDSGAYELGRSLNAARTPACAAEVQTRIELLDSD